METKSIVFVGVGGQGTLLASRIIGHVLLSEGYDVKVSEVHGMSQRGGSVVTYVRYGVCVDSPIVFEGGADCIVSFEKLEALRSVPYLKPDGLLISNSYEIDPMPVVTGAMEYPKDVFEKIRSMGIKLIELNALDIAKKAGNVKCVNVVLIGVLARHLNIPEKAWIDALREVVNPKFLDVNIRAFGLGYNTNL